jgi:hypothetical protein
VRRWWRAHGFGVHSPFAYRFITDTLSSGSQYAYYSYDELRLLWEEAPRRGRISLRRLYAIYRIGLRFGPTQVTLHGADPYGLAAAALAAAHRGKTTVGDSTTDMRVELWAHLASDNAGWKVALESMEFGMSFTDTRMGVIVVDKHLPKQQFELKIR